MSNLSEAIVELFEAQSWEEVANVLEVRPELRGADVETLFSTMVRSPAVSDWQTGLLEDLRDLLFSSGPDPVAVARRRSDLHWAVALELFGPRMEQAASSLEEYQTSADPDRLDHARRRWDALLSDPRLASAPTGFRLIVSDGLAVVRLAEYGASGDVEVLDAGVNVLREAVDATAASSRLRPRRLTNYTAALMQRFHVTGDPADLTASLEASREALSATDPEDPLWPGRANNLAAAISLRSENTDDPAELDGAFRVYEEALAAAPSGSPARARLLHGRGQLFQQRHSATGDVEALETAISCLGEAVDISEGLPDRALFLSDLGIALGLRFDERRELPDLDRSVDRLSEAVEWAVAGPILTRRTAAALSLALRKRHELSGVVDDLRRAAAALRIVVLCTEPTDEDYLGALTEYGGCLQRFVDESTSVVTDGPDSPELRTHVGHALWELYEITRSEAVRERALTYLSNPVGWPEGSLYCNAVIRLIDEIGEAVLRLYGRDLYNAFNRLGQFLQREIHDLITDGHLDTGLCAVQQPGQVLLPGLSTLVTRQIRYVWDYVIFVYMSHKIKNIKRRQMSMASLDLQILLYLRGADYQLAIRHEGAAVGMNTAQDANFKIGVLGELSHRFDLVQAMSPADLNFAMKNIGYFLAEHGNYLSSVAEFARAYDGGVFLNPATWRAVVAQLLPSSSIVVVYVSNQSNGLKYELESLVAAGMEEHTILVLDEERYGSRASFFATQRRLTERNVDLYESVVRVLSAVDDPDAFERLVQRFPHKVPFRKDSAAVRQDLEALIPVVRRSEVEPPSEVPFDFHINLDGVAAAEADRLRRRVTDTIQMTLAQDTVANWPVLVLYLQLDILLSLVFGEVLDAALSTARYAAVADFMRAHLSGSATPEELADLEQSGNIAMNIAYDAFGMGEWNDYSDRRELIHGLADTPAEELTELLRRSVEGAEASAVYGVEHNLPEIDPNVHAQLMKELMVQMMGWNLSVNDGEDQKPESS